MERLADYATFRDWLLDIPNRTTPEVTQKIFMTLDAIWRERNLRVWENKSTTTRWMVRSAIEELGDWLKARGASQSSRELVRQECDLWHPPPGGKLKCNTDAAIFNDEGKSGGGMVLRNHQGELLSYRSIVWDGVWRPVDAECRAVIEALSWMEQEGSSHVIFYTDAKQVVEAVHSRQSNHTELGEMIETCRAIMARNPDFEFGGRRSLMISIGVLKLRETDDRTSKLGDTNELKAFKKD
ncbi:hypothetical protein LINPERHAP1_LOCUS10734 [Linum perenne]